MNNIELQVLLVEDEDSKIEQWNDAVDAFNADTDKNKFQIIKISAKSVSEALALLETRKLDAVIVDLRLQSEVGVGEDNDDGNELINRIVEIQPIGIVIYTGQKGQADVGKFPQVQVMDKGDGLQQVFDWLTQQLNLFLILREMHAAVERETAKIFFRSIWPRWERWTKIDNKENNLAEALARHVAAHVHDSLLNAANGVAHPEETYFVPPLKERLDTGDIIIYNDESWIIVTPRCDLSNEGKIETILLAKCESIAEKWKGISAESKTGAEKIRKIIQHEGSPKQHFLPPAFNLNGEELGPWMVQFHHLNAMKIEEARAQLVPNRIASLAPQFVPSLVERFGAYFSRIGTPNLSSE
ncbi:histidine kinase [Burkholderia seminalis]|uniref:histidine kinase n=1 Tax=Burkholderia seminalis TaxID=488731 RepID=UPI00145337DB|nr:histidine kinase [Burkholderia seminalis]MCA8433311.1 hypothetical protein [Burkholderia seminalis]VWC38244.1 hypothetical protein BSE24067_06824 [Burkholderia seminalis]